MYLSADAIDRDDYGYACAINPATG